MKTKHLKIGKYVIVNDMPILFPVEAIHSEVVSYGQSAGFFVLRMSGSSVDVYCWGESTSLNLVCDQANDAQIISEFIGNLSKVSPHRHSNTMVIEK